MKNIAIKKSLSIILAVTLIMSTAAGIFLGDIVSASEVPLPKISGKTAINTGTDTLNGEYIVVQNTGNGVQNTGTLNGIEQAFSAYSLLDDDSEDNTDSVYIDDNGKIDFAMPFNADIATSTPQARKGRAAAINYTEGDIKAFAIQSVYGFSYSDTEFRLQSQVGNCNVWVLKDTETTDGINLEFVKTKTDELANEFNDTYTQMVDAFGMPYDPSGANKINIMLYDIKDGNNPSAYVAGFYAPNDFYKNGLPMLHIDTYPAIYRPNGAVRIENCYSTLVHEFQHLINDSRYVESNSTSKTRMDTWLNEALAMAAEEMIFSGSAVPMRLNTYLWDPFGEIVKGKQLTEFNNKLDSYALSCLFSAYLKEQTGSNQVFSKIIDEYYTSFDYEKAVTTALQGSALDGLSFDDVVMAYKLALTVNDTRGVYGFKGNTAFDSLRPLVYYGNPINIKSDGMIVLKTSAGRFKPSGNGSDIRFVGVGSYTGAPMISNIPTDMVVGETHTLVGEGDGTLTWNSSDSAVASINVDGKITANAVGSVNITLSNNIATDNVTIIVKDPYVKIKNYQNKLMESMKMQLSVESRPIGGTIAWGSSNTSIATVSSDGLVTAVLAGDAKTTITATDSFTGKQDSFELQVIAKTGFPGLLVDFDTNHIDVVQSIGMETLAAIVNETDYTGLGFSAGLENWTIELANPVELRNHVPIGTLAKPFNGRFNGRNKSIILESVDIPEKINGVGVFGLNSGVIENAYVTIAGTIGNGVFEWGVDSEGYTARIGHVNYVGGVAGINYAEIINPTVNITDNGTLLGHKYVGGVTGDNRKLIKNSIVTNDGNIKSTGSPAGGVAGHTMGLLNACATIDTATVINNNIISSDDDTAAIVGHYQNYRTSTSKIMGKINVTIGASGEINGNGSASASVGGIVGLTESTLGHAERTDITIRIDGNISTTTGSSGGVIGEGGFNSSNNNMPYVAVTLGPNSNINAAGAAVSGLIVSRSLSLPNDISRLVYAVPYDSLYRAAPGELSVNRIEYPIERIPAPPISVDNPFPVINSSNSSNTPSGVFKKMKDLSTKDLNIDIAVDYNIFDLVTNGNTQTIQSKYKLEPNYYDFNMVADGIPIVVPAYLASPVGEEPPDIELEINGVNGTVYQSENDARATPAFESQTVEITVENGRISQYIVELDGIQIMDVTPIAGNGGKRETFSVSQPGLYKVKAKGKPFKDGAADAYEEAYLYIAGIPEIKLNGVLLQDLPNSSIWTNLATSSIVQIQSTTSNRQIDKYTEATAEAIATTIDKIDVAKDGVPFKLINDDYTEIPKENDITRTFKLYETGKYKLLAFGTNINDPAVKYINIDVDVPAPPILDIENLTSDSTSVGYAFVEENSNQSPRIVEYCLNDSEFITVRADTIPLGIGKTRIRIQDSATNISNEIVIERKAISIIVSAEPSEGGIVSGGKSSFITIVKLPSESTPHTFTASTDISATENEGYNFKYWESDDGVRYSNKDNFIQTDKNIELTAYFEKKPVVPPVSSDPVPPVSSEPEPPVSSEPEPPASSEPVPPVSSKPSYSYDPPMGDYVELEYTAGDGGSITGEWEQWIKRYSDGTTITAVPKEGYRFVKWSDGNVNPKRQDTSVFNNIYVTAWFERIPVYAEPKPPVIKPVEVPKTGAKNPKPFIIALASLALGVLGYSVIKFRKAVFKNRF